MRVSFQFHSPLLRRSFSILVSMVILVSASGIMAASPSPARTYRTANNILLQVGTPLPVFKVNSIAVSSNTTQSLANAFSPLAEQTVLEDQYLGHARFTVGNEATGTLLEQFGATGGFYAYNPEVAYGETARGMLDNNQAQFYACQFLLTNELLPKDPKILTGAPTEVTCDYNFEQNPYRVIEAFSNQGTPETNPEAILIALIVQVPMELNTGQFSQVRTIPLSGPGGHMSLLFTTTNPDDEGFSLDPQNAPGLSAAALPFFGRETSFLKNVNGRDPVDVQREITAAVRASFPEGSDITVPDPALVYWVSDAAQPQTTLEPSFEFKGITVMVDGEEMVLRDIVVPAVEGGEEGFGPSVAITAPANSSNFLPGAVVNLAGTVMNGTAPYQYSWSLDDGTVLAEGTLDAAGTINASTSSLPAVSKSGIPSPVLVRLSVTDFDDVTREATLFLNPTAAPSVWLPSVNNGEIGPITPVADSGPAPDNRLEIHMAGYSFGVEAGADYPPYGPGGSDLPGVPPDANGFRTHMLSYGWTQKFYWANASAWEKDWRDCSLGGIDCTYGVDRVDFAYYAGHGSTAGISLPSSVDSSWFPASKARYQTVRWVGFASCLTLRAQGSPAPIRQWFNAFQGAHMLLGFNSLMADVAFGPRLVDNMRMPTFLGLVDLPWAQLTIRQAWVQTAFEMNAGKPAYIYAVGSNGVNPVNNKLPRLLPITGFGGMNKTWCGDPLV
jgi:hypothetical protein